jgi:hypothetical protein
VIYDILGREIATLADEEQGAGSHTVKFNGERFPSGIYLYRITAGRLYSDKEDGSFGVGKLQRNAAKRK